MKSIHIIAAAFVVIAILLAYSAFQKSSENAAVEAKQQAIDAKLESDLAEARRNREAGKKLFGR